MSDLCFAGTLFPFTHQKGVAYLQMPMSGDDGNGGLKRILNRLRIGVRFVLEKPGQSDGSIKDKGGGLSSAFGWHHDSSRAVGVPKRRPVSINSRSVMSP